MLKLSINRKNSGQNGKIAYILFIFSNKKLHKFIVQAVSWEECESPIQYHADDWKQVKMYKYVMYRILQCK